MPKNLFEELVKKPHRETVGASTAARFDYQKSYALLELINRHSKGVEYSVAFEFHDDVLFFDHETKPKLVEFTQVKTSSSNKPKKTSTLTIQRKNTNSVLGKLIRNLDSISTKHEVALVLVSNIPFEFSNDDVDFSDLDDTTKEKISTKLKNEFSKLDDEIIGKFKFKISNISIDNMDTHLRGRVVDLFEEQFGSDYSQSVLSWLRLIEGEIKRKNNYPPDKITTSEELIKNKCIGRGLIEGTLQNLKVDHNPAPDLSSVNTMLTAQGWQDIKVLRFTKAFPIAVTDYHNPTNLECQELCQKIENEIDSLNNDQQSLTDLMESVYKSLNQNLDVKLPYQDELYFKALITVVFYAKL